MNYRPNRKAIFAAAAVMLAGTVALAAAPKPMEGRHRGPALGRMLDLTDEQKTQAKGIFQETRQANEPIVEQLKALRAEERAAIKAGKSEAELRSLAQSGANLMASLHANHLAGEAKFWKILTADQQAKLEKMGERMRERFAERMRQFRERND